MRPQREALEERVVLSTEAWSALGAAIPTGPALVSSVAPSVAADFGSSLESQYALSEAIGRADASYAVSATGSGYALSNAANQYEAAIDAGGFSVTAGSDVWSLTVSGIGYGESTTSLGSAREIVAGNRVEYDYGGVSQWFVNGPLGLQQGFTLAQRPAGAGDGLLTVDLALGGSLTATADAGGRSVTLASADGSSALGYGGLIAYDATGREMPASMTVHSTADGDAISIQVDDADAVYPLVIDPYVQQQRLVGQGSQTFMFFGFSVAISGDGNRAVVGSRNENVGSKTGAGVIYVFDRNGTTWTQTARLAAADGLAGDQFGYSVAISLDGTTVAATSAPGTVGGSAARGAVYVFTNPSGTWQQVGKLVATGGGGNDHLGSTVSISGNGDVIVAGASSATVQGKLNQGAAYIFARTWGDSWSQTVRLIAGDGVAGDAFGSAVAISADGSSVVAAASGVSAGGVTSRGAAYVFEKTITGWSQTGKLLAGDGAADDRIGASVSISSDGSVTLVGAPRVTIDGKAAQGAAYAFARSGGAWSQTGKLTAADGAAGDSFGDSVSLDPTGRVAVIGAGGATLSGGLNQGAAYLFRDSGGGSWSQTDKLATSTGVSTNGAFGKSVTAGLGGTTVMIGASGATIGSNPFQGAAFVLTNSNPGPISVTVSPTSQTATAGAPTTFTAAASGPAGMTVQWQVSVGGGAWTNIPGATNSWYTFTPSLADWGKRYRAVFASGANQASTAASQVTVVKAETVLKITSSANPRVLGDPLTITVEAAAAVTGAGVPAGGMVTLNVGSNNLALPLTNGRAIFSIPYLPPDGKTGNYLVTASYNGANDPIFASATASTTQVVTLSTTTMVGEVPESVPVGQPVTLRAVLSFPGVGSITPSGGVVLNDFGQPIAISQIAFEGGQWVANFTLNSLTPGLHRFRFVYLGEKMAYPAASPAPQDMYVGDPIAANGAAGSGGAGGEAAGSPSGGAFEVNLASAPVSRTVFAGTRTTFTASPNNPANTSAQWQLSVGGGAWTNIPGATNWWYTLTPTLADSGNRYRAIFSGSGAPETTSPATLTVTKVGVNLRITPSANPRVLGDPLSFTIDAIPAAPGAGVPDGGQISISVGPYNFSGTLRNGRAVFQIPYLEPDGKTGTYQVTASYNGAGDPIFGSATATATQVVVQSTTTIVGQVPASPVPVGQEVTLRAVLSFAGLGSITPSGGVMLNDFGQPIAVSQIAFVGGQWVATFKLKSLAPGNHRFRFIYLGEKMAFAAASPAPQDLYVGGSGFSAGFSFASAPNAAPAPSRTAAASAPPDFAGAAASFAIEEATKPKSTNPFAPKNGASASSTALALPNATTARRFQQRYSPA